MSAFHKLLICFLLHGSLLAKPNIVLFYADDLGWTDTGFQGSGFYETPHLDKLAADGMTFSQAYAGAANCAPSRACLMSGLYSPRHGVYTVGSSERGKSKHRKLVPTPNKVTLDKSFKTLPQSLKTAGYNTCIAGKWHISKDPLEYGFDENFGGCEWGHPKSYFSPYKSDVLSDGPKGEHLPERLAREVSGWIEENQKKPFFVYFPFYSVHTPIDAPDELTEYFESKSPGQHHKHAEYAAMIKSMDLAIGKVLNTLDRLELKDETIVIFTSDNGPHGQVSNARPLRGSKGMYYEGGIREPFIIRWPGKTKAGSSSDVPIHQIDLYPTLINAAGATPPELLDGVDLGALVEGEIIPERDLFWHFPAYLQGKREGSLSPHFRTTPCGVIRRGDWKLIEYFEDGRLELYNLEDDPSEKNNLSKTHGRKRDELHQAMKAWRAKTGAPVPSELNPDYTAAD